MPLLSYAWNENKSLVHIDTVPNGINCGCICPKCSTKLYAKNGGEERVHHFAHESGHECEGAYETVLHLLAKEVIKEMHCIMLPTSNDPTKPSGKVEIHDVEIERWIKEYQIQPDAECRLENGERLLVEFYVSHKADEDKRRIISGNNLLCIEIDINNQDLNKDSLKNFLENSADCREWIDVRRNTTEHNHKGPSKTTQNPIINLAKKRLVELFESGPFFIGNLDKNIPIFNIKDLGYDTIKMVNDYKRFKADLLISNSKNIDKEDIAVCLKGRKRLKEPMPPADLHVIDIVLSTSFGEKDMEEFISTGSMRPTGSVGIDLWNWWAFQDIEMHS